MTRYILIGGYIHRSPDGGKAFCDELVKAFEKPIRILDCLFARETDSCETKFQDDKEFFSKNLGNDFILELANENNLIEQLKNSDVLFFQGGSPRKLIAALEKTGDWVSELDGKTLVGSSGGADAICKYYGVGKTSNIGEGTGLLPIKFIPHWKSDYYADGLEIEWDSLLEKLKLHGEDLQIITLGDEEFKVIEK